MLHCEFAEMVLGLYLNVLNMRQMMTDNWLLIGHYRNAKQVWGKLETLPSLVCPQIDFHTVLFSIAAAAF